MEKAFPYIVAAGFGIAGWLCSSAISAQSTQATILEKVAGVEVTVSKIATKMDGFVTIDQASVARQYRDREMEEVKEDIKELEAKYDNLEFIEQE